MCIELRCWCRDENTKDGEEKESLEVELKYVQKFIFLLRFFALFFLAMAYFVLLLSEDCLRLEASEHYYLSWYAFLLFYAQLFVLSSENFLSWWKFSFGEKSQILFRLNDRAFMVAKLFRTKNGGVNVTQISGDDV